MSTIDEIQRQGKLLKKALIICNGNPPPKCLLSHLWEKTTYRVAADGGANLLIKSKYVPDAVVGDEVVIIGSQGLDHISAEEVAFRWSTINYDVVSSIGSRVPRVYK